MALNLADARALSHEALEEGTQFAPRFDAAGLVTVVTIEHGSNAVLMVAHMNAEAIAATLESGVMHYWSRSRGKLWKKGETSGETQRLVELLVDCDQDALLAFVEQAGRGAACHTGRKSCFYRRVLVNGEGAILEDIGREPLFDPKSVY